MALSDLPILKYVNKNTSFSYLIITIAVFGLGCIISIVNWRHIEARNNNVLVTRYNQELNQSKSILTSSLNQYSLLIDDGTSLLAVNGSNLTQSQWLSFFQTYNLTKNYPGVDAVSFAEYVPSANVSSYLNTVASQGQTNFQITPSGSRDVYAPVTYIGYISPVSLSAMGFDELSNPIRAAAINQAINSGQIAMSGKISLVAVNKGEAAFNIFKPVFSGPTSTLAERQSSIYGFVFIAVNAQEFFQSLLGQYLTPGVAIQIYDSTPKPSNLLYESPNFTSGLKHIASPISSNLDVTFGGRTWPVTVVTSRKLLQASINQSTIDDLLVGIGISAILALILWYFTSYRLRRIYWQQQHELAVAKDELLALASHQLRTPATIVKQYLGVLLQNYSGKINDHQRQIIQTAYDSNERQLEIANQFLDAARLGSGRIVLNKEDLNLNDLVLNVVSEQQKIAKALKKKIIFNSPKRSYRINADAKYLPMVFENLISNSIKYSKARSKIIVNLRKSAQEVIISVSDQGKGIAQDEFNIIFEKFAHSSSSKDTDVGGTGIGLYLAQQITDLHGGNISVKSSLGKGSTFTVRLPVAGLHAKRKNV